jgi:hypothetical protein
MKKLLVFILILITTAGSLIPSCQVDNCDAEQLAASNKTENHEPEGACSPFFACTACPNFAELAEPIDIPQPEMRKQIHHEKTISGLLPTYMATLLEPPRPA